MNVQDRYLNRFNDWLNSFTNPVLKIATSGASEARPDQSESDLFERQVSSKTNKPKPAQSPGPISTIIIVPPENLPPSYNELCHHKIIDTEETDFEKLLQERTFIRSYDHPDVKHQNLDLNAQHIRMLYKKMIADQASATKKYSRLELEKDTAKNNRRLFSMGNKSIAENIFCAAQKFHHCTELLGRLEEDEKNKNQEDPFELLPAPTEIAPPCIPSPVKLQLNHRISWTTPAFAAGILGIGATTMSLAAGILGTNTRKFFKTHRMLFGAVPTIAALSLTCSKPATREGISKARERFGEKFDHLGNWLMKGKSKDWFMFQSPF